MTPLTNIPLPQLSMGIMSFAAEDPGSWEPVVVQAELADQAGVDRIVVSDHVVFGEHLDEYAKPERGGQRGGKQPTGPDGHWLEPLTTLTFMAGRTSRVRLGTNILVAALRRPAVLAKAASTLDVLSGGRLDLGVGVGWQKEEYDAAGLDYSGRGRLLDHTIEVCQTLWREPRAAYSSPELEFEAIHQMPKPLQPGGVPIWVSGTINARTVSRLARFGSGWIPWGDDSADLVHAIPRMRDALREAGRDDAESIGVVGYLPAVKGDDGELDVARTMDGLAPLVAAGVTDFRASVKLPADRSAALDTLTGVVRAFREAVGRTD
jgi:probable F420-dependent oxidoreductase